MSESRAQDPEILCQSRLHRLLNRLSQDSQSAVLKMLRNPPSDEELSVARKAMKEINALPPQAKDRILAYFENRYVQPMLPGANGEPGGGPEETGSS